MRLTAARVLISVVLLYPNISLQSQTKRVIVNTPDAMYEMTGDGGSCTYAILPVTCIGTDERIYSTALYNQTLYFLTFNSNKVYSIELGIPGSCTLVGSFPTEQPGVTASTINAFTVDKNGILYGVDNSY